MTSKACLIVLMLKENESPLIYALQELMGRSLRLKFSERTVKEPGDEGGEEQGSEDEPAES